MNLLIICNFFKQSGDSTIHSKIVAPMCRAFDDMYETKGHIILNKITFLLHLICS